EGAAGCMSSDQITVLPCENPVQSCDLLSLPESIVICIGDSLQLDADLSLFESYASLQWSGGGTFIPSDTIANPIYVPSAQEMANGVADLSLQVVLEDNSNVGGNFLAYDHASEDIIFYISTLDGSIDTIQSNTGNDWTAMGFRTATNTLYGISNIVTAPALSSVDINTGTVTPIFSYTNNQFYAGDYDNVNDQFYVIGIPEINSGEPLNQTLYTIDVNTGALNTIGDLNLLTVDNFFVAGGDGINGLAYDPSLDVLWAVTTNGELYEINTNTAELVLVGNTVGDLRGLAYDYNANELWGIDANGTLYHINKLTGDLIEQVFSQAQLGFVTTLTYALPVNGSETVCADNVTVVILNGNNLNLGNDATLCAGESITLTATGFDAYTWQDGSNGDSFSVNESGVYTVNVVDAFGCSYSDSVTITVNDSPNAAFNASPQPTTIENTQITFISASTGNPSTYDWSFEFGIPNASSEENPVVNFPAVPGNYAVLLIVANENGCVDTLNTFIQINESGSLTLPNIFTPNGDGENDRFLPFEEFPGQWQLTVFNRWGTEVFQTNNISQGWNGGDCISGTYYWIIKPLEGQPGESKSGFVMLHRN
ncbi:MAG: gliding motility-associated C-terminal domain-containing protein, partial [Bacteroidota bacterium]